LTFDRRRDETTPVWSPDGREIAYSVTLASGARTGVAVRPATGGSGCMIYTTWSGVDDLQWRPGYTTGPFRPADCSRSLQPRRPAKPILGCSGHAARNAVNRSKLSLRLKQIAHEPSRSGDFRFLCPDFTRDGRADLVVTFSAGVTGNTFRWAAFKRGRRDWHLVASKPGNYMRVSARNHNVVEQLPVVTYQNGFHFTGYHYFVYGWNGRRLALVSRGFHKAAASQ
jgi:hypothetical protein